MSPNNLIKQRKRHQQEEKGTARPPVKTKNSCYPQEKKTLLIFGLGSLRARRHHLRSAFAHRQRGPQDHQRAPLQNQVAASVRVPEREGRVNRQATTGRGGIKQIWPLCASHILHVHVAFPKNMKAKLLGSWTAEHSC